MKSTIWLRPARKRSPSPGCKLQTASGEAACAITGTFWNAALLRRFYSLEPTKAAGRLERKQFIVQIGAIGVRCLLRSRVADFVAQISDQETKPLIERSFFEDALSPQRIVDKCRGHKVGQHFQVAQFGKISTYFAREPAAVLLEAAVKLKHFCPKRFCLDRRRIARFDNVDPGDRKWCFLLETCEAHTLQTLQDQIRCAVIAPDACPN